MNHLPPKITLSSTLSHLRLLFFGEERPCFSELLLNLAERNPACFQLRKTSPPRFLITDPNDIEHVLKTNTENYTKLGTDYDRLVKMFGQGLLTTSSEEWIDHRRILQPTFHKKIMPTLTETSVRNTLKMMNRWQQLQRQKTPILLNREILKCIVENTIQTLFSISLTEDQAFEMADSFSFGCRYVSSKKNLDSKIPTLCTLKFSKIKKRLHTQVLQWVETRKKSNNKPDDMLTAMIEAKFDTDSMIHQIFTFIGAGHETTGHSLTWAIFESLRHPDILKKLKKEYEKVLKNRLPEYRDLENLIFTKQVIEESLRLYPPIWCLERRSLVADTLSNYDLPAGSVVIISPYVQHRLSRYWASPHLFLPERFAPAVRHNIQKYHFIPFGVGPRICIGASFAMTQLHSILATLFNRCELTLLPDSLKPLTKTLVTLKPRLPIRIQMECEETEY